MPRQLGKTYFIVQASLSLSGGEKKQEENYEQKIFEQDFITGISHFDGILNDPARDCACRRGR